MLDHNVTERFFQLSSVAQLYEFLGTLDRGAKDNEAFANLIQHWLDRMSRVGQDKSFPFNPNHFLSKDGTCVMYGVSPVIFLGANDWATKRLEGGEFLLSKAEVFAGRAKFLAKESLSKFGYIVVPEKDVVMDKIAKRSEKLLHLDNAMACIRDSCAEAGLPFVYDGFVEGLPSWASEDDYTFSDSHLLTRDYLGIFFELLEKWGLDGKALAGDISLYSDSLYSDFNVKFDPPLEAHPKYLYPRFSQSNAALVGGDETFASPLGDTVQKIENPTAKIDASLSIFGDSHSSILSSRKMTYMFSSIFRSCNFYWNPWGIRQEHFETNTDYTILEISQRFVF